MSWEAVAALGSIAGTLVVIIATIAALIQLKHLRLANQIDSYLDLMARLNSPELVAARTWLESQNFDDDEALKKQFENGIDSRILLYGGLYQTVARLINHGILDRDLFGPILMTAPRVWKTLRPITYEMRARDPANPRWMDLEYLVYSSKTVPLNLRRYDAEFRRKAGLDRHLKEWLRQARDAAILPDDAEVK